jgi:hypothetical protein
LAAKISRLFANPGDLAAMGARAREYVLARYTWDAVVGRMPTIIDSLLTAGTECPFQNSVKVVGDIAPATVVFGGDGFSAPGAV